MLQSVLRKAFVKELFSRHNDVVFFSLDRYDFDDPEFDELLQMTNDIVEGGGSLNIFIFMPEQLAEKLQTKVRIVRLVDMN